jgi:hypothetical protein
MSSDQRVAAASKPGGQGARRHPSPALPAAGGPHARGPPAPPRPRPRRTARLRAPPGGGCGAQSRRRRRRAHCPAARPRRAGPLGGPGSRAPAAERRAGRGEGRAWARVLEPWAPCWGAAPPIGPAGCASSRAAPAHGQPHLLCRGGLSAHAVHKLCARAAEAKLVWPRRQQPPRERQAPRAALGARRVAVQRQRQQLDAVARGEVLQTMGAGLRDARVRQGSVARPACGGWAKTCAAGPTPLPLASAHRIGAFPLVRSRRACR